MQPTPTYNHQKIKILKLSFNQNTNDSLAIYSNCTKLSGVVLFEDIILTFENCTSIKLSQDCFNYLILTLKAMLKDCLKNLLQKHPSIKKSLGFYWCQYLKKNNRKGLYYKINTKKEKYWIGYDYMLFSSTETIPASWLYNDDNGNIILELTPSYPWFFDKPTPDEIFVKYSQWMKTYKPLLTRTISKETAQQWIKQINDLIKIVKKNDKRLRCTGPGCVHCVKEGKTGCFCGS